MKVTSLLLTCTALGIIYSNRSEIFDAVLTTAQSASDVIQKYTGVDPSEHGKRVKIMSKNLNLHFQPK